MSIKPEDQKFPFIAVYIATSLDGFIARKDGSLDWLEHYAKGEDYGYDSFMESLDLLVMGRNTYQKVLTFNKWPYEKPVLVLSGTLTEDDIPENIKGQVAISSSSPEALVQELAQKGIKKIYLDGGRTIRSFLRSGLVDEIILSRVPILLGEGISLFGHLEKDIKLSLEESKSFESGLVQSRYTINP